MKRSPAAFWRTAVLLRPRILELRLQRSFPPLSRWPKLPRARAILEAIRSFQEVPVVEETYPVIEMQLARRDRIRGMLAGSIPAQGELIPEILEESIRALARIPGGKTGSRWEAIESPKGYVGVSGVYHLTPEDPNGLETDSMVMVQIAGGQWKLLD